MLVMELVRDCDEQSLTMVCAAVDVQGFDVKKVFYPRILTVASCNGLCDFEFKPELPSLSPKDQRTVNFLQNKYHGYSSFGPVSLHEIGVFKSNDLITVLKAAHNLLSSQEKPYFGVANNHLAKILRNNSIPFVDLTKGQTSAPSHKKLDIKYKTNWTCTKHLPSIYSSSFVCSKRKVSNLWQWLQEKIHMNHLVANMLTQAKKNPSLPKLTHGRLQNSDIMDHTTGEKSVSRW